MVVLYRVSQDHSSISNAPSNIISTWLSEMDLCWMDMKNAPFHPAILKKMVEEVLEHGESCAKNRTEINYDITGYG